MKTSLDFMIRYAKRLAGAMLITGSLLMGGCASAATSAMQTNATPPVQADVIYVYAFDASSGQVKMDSSMAKSIETAMSGESFAQKQSQAVIDARNQVADQIVHTLQSMGLRAVRAEGVAPPAQNALVVEGNFQTIDEGKQRRRILIGLGAGKSEVGASVQLFYRFADGTLTPLKSFSVEADSGHMPGIVETAGVGVAAGHVATAAAGGASLHGVSEVKRNGVSAIAKKLGDSVARQVASANAANGWMQVEHTD